MENQIRTIEEFAEAVAQKIRKHLDGERRIEIKKVTKNNGVRLTGLVISSEESKVAPVIYLENFYQDYIEGAVLEEICSKIARAYGADMQCRELDIDFISDFDSIKDKVCCRLLNAGKNQEMLRETPHMLFHDLAAVAYIPVSCDAAGDGAVCVQNGLMDIWGIDKDTLFAHARENTRKLGERVQSMAQTLAEMFAVGDLPRETADKVVDAARRDMTLPMFIASNDKRSFGAAVMLNQEFLQDFADVIENSFYILPSSVHELIFVYAEGLSVDVLRDMVREVNQTQVSPEEVLSDSVYYYNMEAGRVEMA